MPIATRLFDVSLAPGLQAGVIVESPVGSKVRAQSATCYYRGEDQTEALCTVSIELTLQAPPVPLPTPETAVASPGLYGLTSGLLLLAGLGQRRKRRGP